MLQIGIKNKLTVSVTEENTAKALGSGMLDVFATPAMIALMEKTACESVQPFLEEGNGTVGTYLDVKHLASTPIGVDVTCESELIEIDRRRLVFSVTVRDEKELIGCGRHERFIINNDKFMQKSEQKKLN